MTYRRFGCRGRAIAPLSLLALFALAPAAVAQDAVVTGQVYDANGVFVGTVVDYDQVNQAARVHGVIQGSIVQFTIRNLNVSEYLDPPTKRVYFANGDCTGQAYVQAGSDYPALGGVLAGVGGPTQYYFAPTGTPAGNVAAGSYREFELAACTPSAVNLGAYPVAPIALSYALPYSMNTQLVLDPLVQSVPAVGTPGLVALALVLAATALFGLRARSRSRA